MGDQQFFGCRGETLAQRGCLGGDVVATTHHDQSVVFGGQASQTGQGGHHPVVNHLEAAPYLELFDVFCEVPGRHSLVDVLVASQSTELLDPSLDVVSGDPFPFTDRVEVDPVHHCSMVVDHAVTDFHA